MGTSPPDLHRGYAPGNPWGTRLPDPYSCPATLNDLPTPTCEILVLCRRLHQQQVLVKRHLWSRVTARNWYQSRR